MWNIRMLKEMQSVKIKYVSLYRGIRMLLGIRIWIFVLYFGRGFGYFVYMF